MIEFFEVRQLWALLAILDTFGCSGHFWALSGTLGTFGNFWALWALLGTFGQSRHFLALWAFLCTLDNLGTFGHSGHFLALLGILGTIGHSRASKSTQNGQKCPEVPNLKKFYHQVFLGHPVLCTFKSTTSARVVKTV